MVKRRKSGFANARVEQLLRNVGAHRVSADAVYRFNQILTDKATVIAKFAVEIARNTGRKTVKENDIRLASER